MITSNQTKTAYHIAPAVMHSRYSRVLTWLMHSLFKPIDYPEDNISKLQQLAQSGVLVYIMRGHSTWLALCFNYLVNRYHLPLPTLVSGIHFYWLQPVKRLWQAFKQRQQTIYGPWRSKTPTRPLSQHEALLAQHVLQEKTAFVGLPMSQSSPRNASDLHNYLYALVTAQSCSSKPIYLLPHTLVTREQSGANNQSLIDRWFGDNRRPGALRHLAMLYTLRHGTMRMADPLDLQQYMQAHPHTDHMTLSHELLHVLQWRLNEEERVVAGPHLSHYEVTESRVLQNSWVQQAMGEEEQRTGQPSLVLTAKVRSMLQHIAAQYDVGMIKMLDTLFRWVFNRIYSGIVVDEMNFTKVMDAARRGPLIFCPSHRSHMDYLVLSYVLWQRNMTPPHVAAGANLAFFPLGSIFRRAGAFFIRRSFRDEKLYTAVLKAYLKELLSQGTSIEFFIEGGRSRTGKLLMPKFGLLNMLIDAWRHGAREDIQFVPIAIDYERIIEAQSYQEELLGKSKTNEDIGVLLRTTHVLRSRYGRVHLQFGEPISLAQWAQTRQLEQSADPQWDPMWRKESTRLGFQILHQVAMACSVSATSLVSTTLLGDWPLGIPQKLFLSRCHALLAILQTSQARIAANLENPNTRDSALLKALHKFVDEQTVHLQDHQQDSLSPRYVVTREGRGILDYQKNTLMNYFSGSALVARAIIKQATLPVEYDTLYEDVQFLSQLCKKEFIYRVDADFPQYCKDTVTLLAQQRILDAQNNSLIAPISIRDVSITEHLSSLLDDYLQGYWLTLSTIHELCVQPIAKKELVHRTIERGNQALQQGRISQKSAFHRTLIETAIDWACEQALVETVPQSKRSMLRSKNPAAQAQLTSIVAQTARFL